MEERLNAYKKIKAEIDKLKWKIKVLENEEVDASTAVIEPTGVKSQGYKSSPIENRVANNNDHICMYKRQIEELEAEQNMIDSILNTLKEIEKTVIKSRYIDFLKWEEISLNTDRDISRVKEIGKNALIKINKIYNK